MSETYKIVKFADVLRVPAERREDCLRELMYGLALIELAFDSAEAFMHSSEGFTWTDDGVRQIDLMQHDGEPLVTLKITEDATTREGQE